MSILEDLKLQYRIGGIANKMIYWNVGLFILSIPLFYQFASGFFDYPTWLAVSSQPMEPYISLGHLSLMLFSIRDLCICFST